MFSKSARFYDAIYSWKDYEAESRKLAEIIRSRKPDAATLLDVASGTGKHIEFLRKEFRCEGLDLDSGLLAIAERKMPGTRFHIGNMQSFDLGKTFDAVTCLFSSIGYVISVEALRAAIANMAAHVADDGVLIVEPWLGPQEWKTKHVGALFVDEPDLKIARVNTSRLIGDRISRMHFHYIVGTPDVITHFEEVHDLGLFTHEEHVDAFTRAGMVVDHDPEGLMGRGLYIAGKG